LTEARNPLYVVVRPAHRDRQDGAGLALPPVHVAEADCEGRAPCPVMTDPRQKNRPDVEGLKGRAKHKALGLPRGVFIKDGVYWIRYTDAEGHDHKEKIGKRLSLAIKVYQKRKTEIIEGRFFPRSPQKRDITIDTFVEMYLEEAKDAVKGFKD